MSPMEWTPHDPKTGCPCDPSAQVDAWGPMFNGENVTACAVPWQQVQRWKVSKGGKPHVISYGALGDPPGDGMWIIYTAIGGALAMALAFSALLVMFP